MNTEKPIRPDRLERLSRLMLALALLAGVIWALNDGGSLPSPLGNYWR